jgi:broad specificity phosphatase PhoE
VARHAAAGSGHDARAALSVQVVPELYEVDYGRFIGQGYDAIRDEMEQVLDAWRLGFVETPFPGGESALLAQHRVRPFAARLLERAEAHDVAVVAHGRINRVLIATLTGAGLRRLEEFPQSNAGLTEIAVSGGRATLRRLNDTRHLDLASDAFS